MIAERMILAVALLLVGFVGGVFVVVLLTKHPNFFRGYLVSALTKIMEEFGEDVAREFLNNVFHQARLSLHKKDGEDEQR